MTDKQIKMAPPELKALKDLGEESKLLRVPEVVVYEHGSFNGNELRAHARVLHAGDLANEISSIIVVSGTWRFYFDENCVHSCGELGPGYYPDFGAIGFPNDDIESFEPIAY